jgi:hypothetical protein
MQTYKDEVSQEQFYKPRLFTYPDFSKSSTVFDQDDLEQENVMFLLCVREQPEKDIDQDTVYVWKSPDFDFEEI